MFKAKTVMTIDVISVKRETEIYEAIKTMVEKILQVCLSLTTT